MQGFLSETNYKAKEMRKLDRSISKSCSRSLLGTVPVESEMGDYDEGEASGSGSGLGSGSVERKRAKRARKKKRRRKRNRWFRLGRVSGQNLDEAT